MIYEVFALTNHVLAYVAAACTGLVGMGFLRLAFSIKGFVGHMAMGLLLMHLAVLTRTIYWDVVRDIVGVEAWSVWFEVSGGTSVNILFNLMIVLASYHALKALKLSIPEESRSTYTLVGAAFYPRMRIMGFLVTGIRRIWMRLGG